MRRFVLVVVGGLGFMGCSNGDNKTDASVMEAGPDTSVLQCVPPFGGAVTGAADVHCKDDAGVDMPSPVDPAACHPDAMAAADAGPADFGATMFNAEGDDDDCKYHVKWFSSGVCRNGGVTFTVQLTSKTDGKPATGANPYTETVLPPSHLAGGKPTSQEIMPGVYTIGPVVFDQPGQWYVRFHFYGSCEDTLPTSQHAHAAFYVKVP